MSKNSNGNDVIEEHHAAFIGCYRSMQSLFYNQKAWKHCFTDIYLCL